MKRKCNELKVANSDFGPYKQIDPLLMLASFYER